MWQESVRFLENTFEEEIADDDKTIELNSKNADAHMENTFETAFADSEQSATTVLRAVALVASAAKQMQKAAQEGDIGKLHQASEKLAAASDSARQDVAEAKATWPFTQDDAQHYMSNSYEEEFLTESKKMGLMVHSIDARLLAPPSILQLIPSDLAIRIDRKKIRGIRPSHLVKTLLANQNRQQTHNIHPFLEALYKAYTMLNSRDVILLANIYEAFTLQPGSAREYGKSDFAREMFNLDQSNVKITRSGAHLTLHNSTITKGGANANATFTFVAPNGEVKIYSGIRFEMRGDS